MHNILPFFHFKTTHTTILKPIVVHFGQPIQEEYEWVVRQPKQIWKEVDIICCYLMPQPKDMAQLTWHKISPKSLKDIALHSYKCHNMWFVEHFHQPMIHCSFGINGQFSHHQEWNCVVLEWYIELKCSTHMTRFDRCRHCMWVGRYAST